MLAYARRGPRTLAIVAGAAAVVSVVLMALYARSDIERAHTSAPTAGSASILIGAVIAVALRRPAHSGPTPLAARW